MIRNISANELAEELLNVLVQVQHAALKAVETDEKAGDGHTVLGSIALVYLRDFPLAKRELERGSRLVQILPTPTACTVSTSRASNAILFALALNTAPRP